MKTLFLIFAFACFAVAPLVLTFWPLIGLAETFGNEAGKEIADRFIQASLVVSTFFFAATTVFADRLSDNKVHRLSAFLAGVALIHTSIVVLCWIRPDLFLLKRDSTFLYLWLVASFAASLFVWWRVRRTETANSPNRTVSQFSIGSILTWLTLTGILFALFTQSSSLPVQISSRVIMTSTIDQIICAITVPLLALPLTRWLIRTRHFVPVAFGIWIFLFFSSWIVFGVLGLWESEYDADDAWMIKIATFSAAVMLYLVWMAIARFALRTSSIWRERKQPRWPRVGRISFAMFSIVSAGLWIFLATWFVANFITTNSCRYVSHFDESPVIMKELEDAYGADAIERVRSTHNPMSLSELVNCLGRERLPKERDLHYQIASLTKLPYIDHQDGEGKYRKLMGFTKEHVASLPDETTAGWLKANRTDPEIAAAVTFAEDVPNKIDFFEFAYRTAYTPWDESSMPLAARFCREKQPVFQRLRELISEYDDSFMPRFESGHFSDDGISTFASAMLFADTRFALANDDLTGALRNLAIVSKFANTLDFNSVGWTFSRLRIRARAMDALIHIAETRSLDETQVVTVRKIATDLGLTYRSSKIEDANRFAFLMLQHESYMSHSSNDSNYLLLGQKPMANLISAYPQVIDWSVYISASKDRFDRFQQLRNEISGGDSQLAELMRVAEKEPNDEWQFHEHAAGVFDFPTSRSKRIAETILDFEQTGIRIQVLFTVRAKMRNVALELLLHRIEHGRFPDSLKQLDCDTMDPFTGKLLIYRKSGDRFKLYSVGSDGIDGGGEEDRGIDILYFWPESSLEEYLERN